MIKKLKEYFHKKKMWVCRNIYYRLKPRFFYTSPKTMAALWYAYNMDRLPNFKHPRDVNELWMSINLWTMNDPKARAIRIRCADKYAVREYIAEKGYANILNECYGVYDSFDEIDFDKLPNQFALKLTTCSGMNFICRDKSKLDMEKLRALVDSWFEKAKNFGLKTAEWHYVEIKPRLIVEKYLAQLGESSLVDYKIHCFNGQIYHIETISDRDFARDFSNCDAYTADWQRKECVLPHYHTERRMLPRPVTLDKMIEAAKALSADFEYVRVDFYEIGDKLLFGELTFTPAGCIEYDYYRKDLEDMCRFYYATKK